MKKITLSKIVLAIFLLCVFSCSKKKDEEMKEVETTVEEKEQEKEDHEHEHEENGECNDPKNFVFNEKDGYILVEFEDAYFKNPNWKLKENVNTGLKYRMWTGNSSMKTPGIGRVNYKINISSPGVYRFLFNTSVKKGTNGTEHNDSWVRFADATDFYGEKDARKVYPKGTGKQPHPHGASAEGWFKVYRGGKDLSFKWEAATSDKEGLRVYAQFDTPGVYNMEVSARSSHHAIDKLMLFKEDKYTFNQAKALTQLSEITCN